MFERTRARDVPRGDVRMLVRPWSRALRFARVILVGTPIWFAGGVLFVFAPEIGGALGLATRPTGAKTILWAYVGVVLGDVLSGALSQRARSRKRVLGGFLVALAGALAALMTWGGRSLAVRWPGGSCSACWPSLPALCCWPPQPRSPGGAG